MYAAIIWELHVRGIYASVDMDMDGKFHIHSKPEN